MARSPCRTAAPGRSPAPSRRSTGVPPTADAALGEDLDHARGGLGAVQRARCRALDDLDVVNIGGGGVVVRARPVGSAPGPLPAPPPPPGAAVTLPPHPGAVRVDGWV